MKFIIPPRSVRVVRRLVARFERKACAQIAGPFRHGKPRLSHLCHIRQKIRRFGSLNQRKRRMAGDDTPIPAASALAQARAASHIQPAWHFW
jgi:hypothetical protein